MLVFAIIVYNRFENIARWMRCIAQCRTPYDVMFVVIHNDDGNSEKFRSLCDKYGVTYISRKNIGYDIGALQDVAMGRLKGFPDFDWLLWCTDDVVPMQLDFISPFVDVSMNSRVGVVAMQISTEYTAHVRTGCFYISRSVLRNIKFPADPVTTKQHCYNFEHRGGQMTFTNQIRRMGLTCEQVAPLERSPMYDTEYWKRNRQSIPLFHKLNRDKEHRNVFG